MLILGGRSEGRLTEQHDVFFGIGKTLSNLIPQMKAFWPGCKGLHIDSWREVTEVNGYSISVIERSKQKTKSNEKLFFINLGGYKENDMEEYHYKLLTVSNSKTEALKSAKQTAFFKHTGIKAPGGNSHIDDKFGVDVDDAYEIDEVLENSLKAKYSVIIKKEDSISPDQLNIGYLTFSKIK